MNRDLNLHFRRLHLLDDLARRILIHPLFHEEGLSERAARGVFVAKGFGGVGFAEGVGMGGQVWIQTVSVVATLVYSGVVSFLILKIVDAMVGLRADANEESGGLDLMMHNESAYER